MLNEQTGKDLLATMVNKISEVMAIMDGFQDSRSGSIAFTKLEESLMWLQVLTHNVPLKPKDQVTKEDVVSGFVAEDQIVLTQNPGCC